MVSNTIMDKLLKAVEDDYSTIIKMRNLVSQVDSLGSKRFEEYDEFLHQLEKLYEQFLGEEVALRIINESQE